MELDELLEDTGMIARTVRPIGWTSDVLLDEGLRYVTLHHVAETTGVPVRREPDKIDGWSWHAWDSPPRTTVRSDRCAARHRMAAAALSLGRAGVHPRERGFQLAP